MVKAIKLTDKIDITIKKGQQAQKNPFLLTLRLIIRTKYSKPSFASNTPPAPTTILLNKITNTGINLDYSVKQLSNPYIKSKYTKIVKYKKMTLTTHKPKKMYLDLCGPHNLVLLLEKIYISLFLMNSHVNHRFCSSGAKKSSLIPSNSSYYALKLIKRNLNAYKSMIEGNLSLLPSKAFIKRKILLLTIQHRTYIKKTR